MREILKRGRTTALVAALSLTWIAPLQAFAQLLPPLPLHSGPTVLRRHTLNVNLESVRALRFAVTQFSRVPESQQEARLTQIRDAATELRAAELPWVDNFLRAKGAK